MTPQLEAMAIAALGAVAICAATITWAAVRADRARTTWTAAVNNVAARVTEETNARRQLEARVATMERARTTPGPRLGVVPGGGGQR